MLSSYFYERRKSAKMMAADAVTSISEETFKKIDLDGNGYLDRSEFLAYTLLKYDVVDESLIEEIFKQYGKFEGASTRRVTHKEIAQRQQKLLTSSQDTQ